MKLMERINTTVLIAFCCAVVLYLGGCRYHSGAPIENETLAQADVQVSNVEVQTHSDALMDQWRRETPDHNWVEVEMEKHTIVPGSDNQHVMTGAQAEGHAYGKFTRADLITWQRETEKFVVAGSRIFHDANALESKKAVSCDMCHPDAANTHPETYPKFQVQMGRTVLLRDMINWCLEHPVHGKPLDADDFRLRALEAYIIAQRRGVELDYNKH